METRSTPYSDLPVSPGLYLSEILDEANLTQAELARRMGRPVQAINEIIKGDKAITAETALQMEQVLGVPAHIWTSLEAEYQLVKARLRLSVVEREDADLLGGISYSDIARFADLRRVRSPHEQVHEISKFLGVSSLRNIWTLETPKAAFRKSKQIVDSPLALSVWLRKGLLTAESMDTGPYNDKGLKGALNEIRKLTIGFDGNGLAGLQKLLAEAGVVFVHMPQLKNTGVHGATFWVSRHRPVLLTTFRFKWLDIFWFSLFHEIGHVLLHGQSSTFVELNSAGETRGSRELEADKFAIETLVPSSLLNGFIDEGRLSKPAVRKFSDELGIHPGIVVGRLQHLRIVPKSWFNDLRSRIE